MGLRRRMLLCLASSLVVGVLAAPAAQAGPLNLSGVARAADQLFPVGGSSVAKAQAIAVAYWGATPCGGDITVAWGPLPAGTNALSNWWNPVATYGNAASNIKCTVTLNPAEPFDWPMLCTVLVHEYGHLSGHQHAADPADVMYAVYSAPISQCAESADPNPPAPTPAGSTFAGADPAAGLAPASARRAGSRLRHAASRSRTPTGRSARRAAKRRHKHPRR